MNTFEFIIYSSIFCQVTYNFFPEEEYHNHFSKERYDKAVANNVLRTFDDYTYDNEVIIAKLTGDGSDTNDIIKAIIDDHIEEVMPENYIEELLPLDGGLKIEINEQIIEPQCCSDINDYHNWQKILAESLDSIKNWQPLWIGHPHIFYRLNGNNIELSDYTDRYEVEFADDVKVKICLDKVEFFQALEKALAQLQAFKQRIYQVIDNGDYQNKENLKKCLID